MKNEFLSVVSHELRTPLTSIRGSLGLISSGALVELTPQAERMVSIAVESSDRLIRLINDILDIERIQSGKLPMSLVPHDAAALLRAAAVEMGGLAGASDVRLEVVATTGRVLADQDRIVQTLTNLVGNAIKFSPPGSNVRLESSVGADTVTFAVRRRRPRHPRGQARGGLRPLRAGRLLRRPPEGRHRPGAGHQPRASSSGTAAASGPRARSGAVRPCGSPCPGCGTWSTSTSTRRRTLP